MRLDLRHLLIARPVRVDHAQLVIVPACAGEDESPDVFLGWLGSRRQCIQRSRQASIRHILH